MSLCTLACSSFYRITLFLLVQQPFSPTAFAVEPSSLDFNVSYNLRSPYPNATSDIVNKTFWIRATDPEFPVCDTI